MVWTCRATWSGLAERHALDLQSDMVWTCRAIWSGRCVVREFTWVREEAAKRTTTPEINKLVKQVAKPKASRACINGCISQPPIKLSEISVLQLCPISNTALYSTTHPSPVSSSFLDAPQCSNAHLQWDVARALAFSHTLRSAITYSKEKAHTPGKHEYA
eukprot:1672737-Pleurochrysis_carterae.AAC.1